MSSVSKLGPTNQPNVLKTVGLDTTQAGHDSQAFQNWEDFWAHLEAEAKKAEPNRPNDVLGLHETDEDRDRFMYPPSSFVD